MAEMTAAGQTAHPKRRARRIYRHTLPVRIAHWLNVLCLALLLMSGLQIFNAHPALYLGEDSDFARPVFAIVSGQTPDGRPIGITHVFGRDFETTGLLCWSTLNGYPAPRAFPGWITIPPNQDLATGRVWHFFFVWVFVINGTAYLVYAIAGGHVSRDLLPRREQLARIGETIRDHLRLRFHQGPDATRYNVIQQITYLVVIFVLLPLMVLTGLTMSPAADAAAPWLPDLFGGRQSARTVHFAVAWLLVAFVFVHIAMVVVSGFFNNMRTITTGWFAIDPKRAPSDDPKEPHPHAPPPDAERRRDTRSDRL